MSPLLFRERDKELFVLSLKGRLYKYAISLPILIRGLIFNEMSEISF
jgi:hypothetical protein